MSHVTAARIKVRVLHSEPLITAGVLYSLGPEAGLDVAAGEHGTWRDADVVVTDLPQGMQMADDLRQISFRHGPPPRVLVLSANDREFEVRRAMESGVHGYILASCDAKELLRGVKVISSGARYMSVEVAQRVADSMSRTQLTAREYDVLQLLVKGNCNKTIARALTISIGTVKAHVKAILAKLNATSRTHAVSLAVERGLVLGHGSA